MKLYFEQEKDAIYKIGVRVIVPNEVTGYEETVYRRVFDENAFFQVCDSAYKKEVGQYYLLSSNQES
jgi:hypothetical protein